MSLPRVICHMIASVDGRIVTDKWPLSPEGRRQYELVHASYEPDGWLCGRVTMEQHFAQAVRTDAQQSHEHRGARRQDFRAPGAHDSFAFAVDARGRLAWNANEIDGDHVVAILSERVSDEYLAFLRERDVSYLLAGEREVDLALALRKIGESFSVKTLMLEGGGRINGGMLRAGLVDELSLLIAPVVDGRMGTPAVFDIVGSGAVPYRLALKSVEQRADDVIWVRYLVNRDSAS